MRKTGLINNFLAVIECHIPEKLILKSNVLVNMIW